MNPLNFNIINLGCNANRADADKIQRELLAAGAQSVDAADGSDLVVIMTCAFTVERQRESVQQIRTAVERGVRRVVVAGCLPDIAPECLADFGPIEIIRPQEMSDALLLKRLWPDSVRRNTGWPTFAALDNMLLHRVRVSRGCLGKCSFCVIPRATGPLQSRAINDVRREVQGLVSMGARKILLAGEDVGAYGQDSRSSLGRLLEAVLELDGSFELMVESINPQWLALLIKEHSSVVADPRVSSRWYVPIQAASNRLLNLMRRPYSLEAAENALRRLRELKPDAYVITDIIAGHPGERDEDIEAAAEFFVRQQIDYLEAMCFDAHQGTTAATMSNQVDVDVRRRRTELVISAFLLQMFRRRGLTSHDAVDAFLESIAALPVNTNLDFSNQVSLVPFDDKLSGTRTSPGTLADRLSRELDVLAPDGLSSSLVRRMIRKLPRPKAVALDMPEAPARALVLLPAEPAVGDRR